MRHLYFSIDTEGLTNNHLHIYKRNYEVSKDGKSKTTFEPVDLADFIITDRTLSISEQLQGLNSDTIKHSKDVTPKQLHNIIFFEMLKAFRR